MNATVTDDIEGHRFVVQEDGTEAELRYVTKRGRLVLVHTEVPARLAGKGIGGQLVQAALDRAARSGERVLPACPFARKWIEEHPDRTAGVMFDWRQPHS